MRCGAAHRLKCLGPSGGIVLESRIRKAEDFFFADFKVAKMLKLAGQGAQDAQVDESFDFSGFGSRCSRCSRCNKGGRRSRKHLVFGI